MAEIPTTAAAKPLTQPSTFGHPRVEHSHIFFRTAKNLLAAINHYLFTLTIISCSITLILGAIAGLLIKHEEIYSSDGTMYSCKLDVAGEKK